MMDPMEITKSMTKNTSNLFDALWIEKYRPKTLNDIVLSNEDREFFSSLAEQKEIPHLLFSGVQGTGKTSLSKILVNDILRCQYLYINASDENGIDTVRGKIINFAGTKSIDGKIKVVLLDESDSISLDGQKILRSVMEEYSSNTRFILTCNYLFKVIPPIQSRCQIIRLTSSIEGIVERIVQILKKENIEIEEGQKPLLLNYIQKNFPDLRRIINDIQKFSFSGKLKIINISINEFASDVFKRIKKGDSPISLRKYIIENEKEFSNDYHHLLKELFEVTFKSDLNEEKKATCLLLIAEGMKNDVMVLDKEINSFATLINLSHSIFS